jgi:hypothetical protein
MLWLEDIKTLGAKRGVYHRYRDWPTFIVVGGAAVAHPTDHNSLIIYETLHKLYSIVLTHSHAAYK